MVVDLSGGIWGDIGDYDWWFIEKRFKIKGIVHFLLQWITVTPLLLLLLLNTKQKWVFDESLDLIRI